MRRNSLLICSRLPARRGRDHIRREAVGERDPQRERRLAAAPVERAQHELLVGVAAAGHAGGDEGRCGGVDDPQLDRLAGARTPRVGQPERVAGAATVDAAHAVAVPVGHALHAAHVGVVAGQVGEVEAVAPHGLGRDREDGGGDGGRRGGGRGGGHRASVCRGGGRRQVMPGRPLYTRCVKVVGLYLVRNEVDIMEVNLRHHFATGIDEAIVIDNGSTDGTLEVIADLAEELPIQLSSEVGSMSTRASG